MLPPSVCSPYDVVTTLQILVRLSGLLQPGRETTLYGTFTI